jgi:hypothetical protein
MGLGDIVGWRDRSPRGGKPIGSRKIHDQLLVGEAIEDIRLKISRIRGNNESKSGDYQEAFKKETKHPTRAVPLWWSWPISQVVEMEAPLVPPYTTNSCLKPTCGISCRYRGSLLLATPVTPPQYPRNPAPITSRNCLLILTPLPNHLLKPFTHRLSCLFHIILTLSEQHST